MRLCVDVGRTTFGWEKKEKVLSFFFWYQGVDPVITGNDGHRRAEKNDNEEKTQGFLGFMFVYDIKRSAWQSVPARVSQTPRDGWSSIWSVPFFFLHSVTSQQRDEPNKKRKQGIIRQRDGSTALD